MEWDIAILIAKAAISAFSVSGFAASLAAGLPPERPDSSGTYRLIRTVIDLAAWNVGNAKNAPPPEPVIAPRSLAEMG